MYRRSKRLNGNSDGKLRDDRGDRDDRDRPNRTQFYPIVMSYPTLFYPIVLSDSDDRDRPDRTLFYPGDHDRPGRPDRPSSFHHCFHIIAWTVCTLFRAIGAIIWKPGFHKYVMECHFITYLRSHNRHFSRILAFIGFPCPFLNILCLKQSGQATVVLK